MENNIYLSSLEQQAIELLASGQSYTAICQALDIHPFRANVFFTKLRKKTGIESTKNPQPSRDYLNAFKAAQGPSALQKTWIAYWALKGSPPSNIAENAMSAALHAAGIFATDPTEQRLQCGAYVAHDNAPHAPTFTPLQKRILELYAQGQYAWYISKDFLKGEIDPPEVEKIIREGCEAMRVISRGRGVQRRLVGIALDAMQKTAQDPLDAY